MHSIWHAHLEANQIVPLRKKRSMLSSEAVARAQPLRVVRDFSISPAVPVDAEGFAACTHAIRTDSRLQTPILRYA